MALEAETGEVPIRFRQGAEVPGQSRLPGAGGGGQSASAALAFTLTNDPVAQVRQCAAGALGAIGKDAASAAPALLITAKDKDDFVRPNSLIALSRIHAPLEIVLPGLIAGLDDPFQPARENAAFAMGGYGPLASNAVPALIRARSSNRAADFALGRIVPERAVDR